MPDYRGDIRRMIFTKVRDGSVDVMGDAIAIDRTLVEYSRRYENFDELERLNVEIAVPIQLPPGGRRGDCLAVVEEVQRALAGLGGGTTAHRALGSWLDEKGDVVSDHCAVVYTAMPIRRWYECIPVLQRLIRDEVQGRLLQRCVFIRIDNQAFGDPINLLGEEALAFPGQDEFGGVDPACLPLLSDYEEHPVRTVVDQNIEGDGNTQIHSGRDTINATGDGAMSAGGDITQIINQYQGMDEEQLRAALEKILPGILLSKLSELGIGTQSPAEVKDLTPEEEEKVDEALEGAAAAEEAGIKFDPWEYITLGDAAELRGRTFTAEGYYREALRMFLEAGDRDGEASSLGNLGLIAYTRGDYDEAERLHGESLAIRREIGDRQGEAVSLNNLGTIASRRDDHDGAEGLHRESLAIEREIGSPDGEAASLNNLGNIAARRGDYDEAERLLRESLAIKREIGDRHGEAQSLSNLGIIAYARGDHDGAERLQRESVAIMREVGDRQGEAASLGSLGLVAYARGDHDGAERLQRESLAIDREIGNRHGEAQSLGNLGIIAYARGDHDGAERLQRESLAIDREIGNRQGEASSLGNLGLIAYARGDYDGAEGLHRESLAIDREIGNRYGEAQSLGNLGDIAYARGDYDESEGLYRESVRIKNGIGVPLGEWYIENGYTDPDAEWNFPPPWGDSD